MKLVGLQIHVLPPMPPRLLKSVFNYCLHSHTHTHTHTHIHTHTTLKHLHIYTHKHTQNTHKTHTKHTHTHTHTHIHTQDRCQWMSLHPTLHQTGCPTNPGVLYASWTL